MALLHDSTNYGVSGRDDLLSQIQAPGRQAAGGGHREIQHRRQGHDGPAAAAPRPAGPRPILIWGIGPELAAVANGMAKLGMKIPLIGGWTLAMSNFIDNAGKNGNGTLMPQTFIEEAGHIPGSGGLHRRTSTRPTTCDPMPSAVSAAAGLRRGADLRGGGEAGARAPTPTRSRRPLENLKRPGARGDRHLAAPFSQVGSRPTSTTHEAFRRDQAVMGKVKDGRVVFANQADRRPL